MAHNFSFVLVTLRCIEDICEVYPQNLLENGVNKDMENYLNGFYFIED